MKNNWLREIWARIVEDGLGHGRSAVGGLDAHQRRQHGDALRRGQVPVAPRPVFRLALDALVIGEVLAGTARPEQPLRGEVEPQLLGAHPGLVHDLQFQRLPCP